MAKASFLLAAAAFTSFASANVHDLPGHEWIKAGPGDARSPCPALNVLANHGYLPRNGRNVTKAMLMTNIQGVYNLDPQLADFFAQSGVTVLGPELPSINLSDLAKHDSIEHDASLTREDARTGDNLSMQPRLLAALLADAEGATLSVESLAKSRNRRGKESQEGGSPALSVKMRTLAYGESALILQALGKLGQGAPGELLPPKDAVQTWIGEERLPNNWQKPDVMTLGSTTSLSGKVLLAANLQEPAPLGLLGSVLSGAANLLRFPAGGRQKRAEKAYYGHGMWA